MLLRAIEFVHGWIASRMVKKVHRYMEILYPEPDERYAAYIAEGAQLANTVMFGEGEVMQGLAIFPEEDGYRIQALEEQYED